MCQLRSTLIHMSVLYVSPRIGAQTSCPWQSGSLADRLSLTTLLFEYDVISLSHGRYSIIYKLHNIYKLQLSISYYLQANNYLQGLLHHRNNPYKQGLAIPTPFYKYQVPSHSFHTHSHSTNSCTYLSIRVLYFAGSPSCPLNKGYSLSNIRDIGAYFGHVHPNVGQLQILVSTFGAHRGVAVKHNLRPLFSPMVSTRFGLRCETSFIGSNPSLTIMTNTDTL